MYTSYFISREILDTLLLLPDVLLVVLPFKRRSVEADPRRLQFNSFWAYSSICSSFISPLFPALPILPNYFFYICNPFLPLSFHQIFIALWYLVIPIYNGSLMFNPSFWNIRRTQLNFKTYPIYSGGLHSIERPSQILTWWLARLATIDHVTTLSAIYI